MAKKTPKTEPQASAIEYKYATREAWLMAFVQAAKPIYEAQGLTIPDKLRVSIGWPYAGGRSKVIGECWVPGASDDAHSEIFVVPSLKEPGRIAGVLTHELVHACVGSEAKHGPVFKRAAMSLGLEGKMTATTEGAQWHTWADPVIEELGPYPGDRLSGGIAGGKKKQTTRLLKASCPVCEFTTRVTRKWVDAAEGRLFCPMPEHMTCEEVEGRDEDAERNELDEVIHDGTMLQLEEPEEGEGE